MLQALLVHRAPSHSASSHSATDQTAGYAKACSDIALTKVQPWTSDNVQTNYAPSLVKRQAAHNSQLDFAQAQTIGPCEHCTQSHCVTQCLM
jgi:hypothetical protein